MDLKPKFLAKDCVDRVGQSALNQFPVAAPCSSVSVTATIEMNDELGTKNLDSAGFKPSHPSQLNAHRKDIEVHPLANQTNHRQEQLAAKPLQQHHNPRNVRSEPSTGKVPSSTRADKSSIIQELLKSKDVSFFAFSDFLLRDSLM